MPNLILSQNKIAIVDPADYEIVNNFKWTAYRGKNRWYAFRCVKNEKGKWVMLLLHRFLMGAIDRKTCVDHIDGNGLNNSRHNLRLATHQENNRNRGPNKGNLLGVKGVSWDKKSSKYLAAICINKKRIAIGRFSTIEEAQAAYQDRAQKEFGDFLWKDNNI